MNDTTTYRTTGLRRCLRAAAAALRLAAAVAFAALFGVLPAGCTKELTETPPSRRPLVVYMALDNDLRGEFSSRLAALRAGWRPGMELWVYADTPEGASLGRMDSTPEGVALRTVERYGEENSASGATLERVLRTVWRLCPSDGYGLLFFSHATGWLPEGGLQAPLVSRSIGLDQGSEMSLDAFVSAIPSGMPLDYVIFEACLMAGAEVALALAGHTDWVLASSAEVVEPGFRPLYAENLALLTDGGRPVEEQLAAFGQRYMAHVRTLSGTGCSATLSLIRTSSMPALAEAVRRVTRGFADEEGRDTPPAGLQHFDRPGAYGDRPAAARFYDLEAYVEACLADPDAEAAFRGALADAVVWRDATERFLGGDGSPYKGFDIGRHSGLTLYVPRGEFPALNETYRRTAWWQATREEVY
ncbi:clostripain-related cysteine peptidase [Alistipes dispar]|uniref:clostripain-related cysteine peptidase n=1 Tax=Alistipes dispar TaxID=2585119 RepID=UPI003AB59A50